jgi:hypothetical protein
MLLNYTQRMALNDISYLQRNPSTSFSISQYRERKNVMAQTEVFMNFQREEILQDRLIKIQFIIKYIIRIIIYNI